MSWIYQPVLPAIADRVSATEVKWWDGTVWNQGTFMRWNSTDWVGAVVFEWDGTQWVRQLGRWDIPS